MEIVFAGVDGRREGGSAPAVVGPTQVHILDGLYQSVGSMETPVRKVAKG